MKAKRGQPWTEILEASGLECPGYHEISAEVVELVAERKRLEAHRQVKKRKGKKR
jgi:hypothetical protein